MTESYPTVWAYEQVCKTLETTKNEVRNLKAQLRVAEQAYGEQKIKCAYQFAKREEAERMNAVNFAERQKMGEALERITAERRAWQSEREQMVNDYLRDQGEIERLRESLRQANLIIADTAPKAAEIEAALALLRELTVQHGQEDALNTIEDALDAIPSSGSAAQNQEDYSSPLPGDPDEPYVRPGERSPQDENH